MVVQYRLPSSIIKDNIAQIFLAKLLARKKNDFSIKDIIVFLDNLKDDDSEKYNQFLGNMILMYCEVAVARDMLYKQAPDIYGDDEIELLEELVYSVDDYRDLSNIDIENKHTIDILLLATISYCNLSEEEKDQVAIEGKKQFPNLYDKFSPNNKIDEIIMKIKRNISIEELFGNPILESYLKLRQDNCPYDLAIKNISDYFPKYVRNFDRKQYEIGMRDIITKYYIFEKGLLELGNKLDPRERAIINYIDNENNSYSDILDLVSRGINRNYLISGYIKSSLYATSHFNNQIDTIDREKGFSVKMKKRFNN